MGLNDLSVCVLEGGNNAGVEVGGVGQCRVRASRWVIERGVDGALVGLVGQRGEALVLGLFVGGCISETSVACWRGLLLLCVGKEGVANKVWNKVWVAFVAIAPRAWFWGCFNVSPFYLCSWIAAG